MDKGMEKHDKGCEWKMEFWEQEGQILKDTIRLEFEWSEIRIKLDEVHEFRIALGCLKQNQGMTMEEDGTSVQVIVTATRPIKQ